MTQKHKEMIQKVIDKIKAEDNFFSMLEFFYDPDEEYIYENFYDRGIEVPDCKTPACICGWTNDIKNEQYRKSKKRQVDLDDVSHAANALGLSYEEADILFRPPHTGNWQDITREDAIRTLEHLRDTGEVKWEF